MKTYEALIILEGVSKDEDAKDLIEKIQKDIEHTGGRVEKIQRLGQRAYARTTAKRSAGYYVNIIFKGPASAVKELDAKFHLEPNIFRWQFTEPMPEPPPRRRREGAETVSARE